MLGGLSGEVHSNSDEYRFFRDRYSASDSRVELLEALNRAPPAAVRRDPLGGGDRRGGRRNVGALVLDGRLPDVGVVVGADFPHRRVDDQLDLSVPDRVGDVGTSL